MTFKEIITEFPKVCSVVDGHNTGTDKNTDHSYLDYYQSTLEPYQNKKINFLEIGVDRGGSLFLWKKFFDKAIIYAIEKFYQITDADFTPFNPHIVDKVYLIIAEAYDELTANMVPNFDVIVDDGPHNLWSYIRTVQLYGPKLNAGGIFILEDIQNEEWKHPIQEEASKVGLSFEFVDLRHIKNRFDDMLFVLRKK
jgi:hypothetical protein